MGVPAFVRWVTKRYPEILLEVVEEETSTEADAGASNGGAPPPTAKDKEKTATGQTVTVRDNSGPEGARRRVDVSNLYVDCNGVVHPCCHPEGEAAPESEDEMLERLGLYLDKLVARTKPSKLVYLALDGVAPRAKMTQQRRRRYCAAREVAEKAAAMKVVRDRLGAGKSAARRTRAAPWDSNAITPGTPFMDKVAEYLREWAKKHVATVGTAAVIVSDASVPGEGEHKIVDHIRRCARSSAGETHVVVGQDADLVFLALALHVPRVLVARDAEVPRGSPIPPLMERRLAFLSAQRLRKCVELDSALANVLRPASEKKNSSVELLIDDLVLLCVLVGNDFVPQLPCLSIPDGGLDLLLALFANRGKNLHRENKQVDLKVLAEILKDLAALEPEILRRKTRRDQSAANSPGPDTDLSLDDLDAACAAVQQLHLDAAAGVVDGVGSDDVDAGVSSGPDETAAGSDESTKPDTNTVLSSSPPPNQNNNDDGATTNSPEADEKDLEARVERAARAALAKHADGVASGTASGRDDQLRLGSKGFRDRYYRKLCATAGLEYSEASIRRVCEAYIEGLAFVERYYRQGATSWSWSYPYHYAPLAADLAKACARVKTLPRLDDASPPVSPLIQLLSVLPPASAALAPAAARALMTSPDSPVAESYPRTFELDPNGKPASLKWLWVALLPPANVDAIADAFDRLVVPSLTPEEAARNAPGVVRLVPARAPKSVASKPDKWTNAPGRLAGQIRLRAETGALEYKPPEPSSRGKVNAPPDPALDLAVAGNFENRDGSGRSARYPVSRESLDTVLAVARGENPRLPQTTTLGPSHPVPVQLTAHPAARVPPPALAGRGPHPGSTDRHGTRRAGAGANQAVPANGARGPAPCRYWARGFCARGSECAFLHNVGPMPLEYLQPLPYFPVPRPVYPVQPNGRGPMPLGPRPFYPMAPHPGVMPFPHPGAPFVPHPVVVQPARGVPYQPIPSPAGASSAPGPAPVLFNPHTSSSPAASPAPPSAPGGVPPPVKNGGAPPPATVSPSATDSTP